MDAFFVKVNLRWITRSSQVVCVEADSQIDAINGAQAWANKQDPDWFGSYEDVDHDFMVVQKPSPQHIQAIEITAKGQTLSEINMPLPPDYAIYEFSEKRWALFGDVGSCHGAFLVDAFPNGLNGLKGCDWYKAVDRKTAQEGMPKFFDAETEELPETIYVDRRYATLLAECELSIQRSAIAARKNGLLVAIVSPLTVSQVTNMCVNVGRSAEAAS